MKMIHTGGPHETQHNAGHRPQFQEQNLVGRAKRSVPDNGVCVGHGLAAFAQPTVWWGWRNDQ